MSKSVNNTLLKSIINIHSSKSLYNYLNDCQEKGLVMEKNVSIQPFKNYYTLINNEYRINENEIIARIPIQTGFNGFNINIRDESTSKVIKEQIHEIVKSIVNPKKNLYYYDKLVQQLFLTFEIYLNSMDKDSNYYDFIDSLPKDCNSLLNLGNKKIENLVKSKIISSNIAINYSQVYSIFEEFMNKKLFEVDSNLFTYSYLTANSQKINFNSEKGEISLIAPVLNLINHSFNENIELLEYYDEKIKESFILLKSIKTINQGEQLFINKGDSINNLELAIKYGIVDETNINNFIKLPVCCDNNYIEDMFKNASDSIKIKIIQMNDNVLGKELLLPNYEQIIYNDITLYPKKFSSNILKLLRISLLNKNELNNCSNHDFSLKYTNENEVEVNEYLKEITTYYLEALHPSSYYVNIINELRYNQNCKDNIDLFNISLIEKEERDILESNYSYLNKRKLY